MENIIDIINVVGVIGATIISTITLFTTRALQRSQQKATIMTNKRSERIDLMREYSAGIISSGKHILYGLDDDKTKANLICFVDKFNSLFQYQYKHDVELINCANAIVENCVAEELNKEILKFNIDKFWKLCDIYAGVEYERLKVESMGDIKGSGEVKGEAKTFEDIYVILEEQQKNYTSTDENK